MKTWLRNFGALTAFSLLLAGAAHAIPITLSFTAAGFVGPDPAPNDPLSGTIVYEAASVTSPIESLISISLTIGDHTYTLDEIGFVNDGTSAIVGGLEGGVLGSGNFMDDFWIVWEPPTLLPLNFLYAALVSPAGIWETSTFSQFSVAAAVPEPAPLVLLAFGIGGMFAARHRKARS